MLSNRLLSGNSPTIGNTSSPPGMLATAINVILKRQSIRPLSLGTHALKAEIATFPSVDRMVRAHANHLPQG